MDWNHHATLLHIADKANQWPQLHWLRDKTIEQLQKLKDESEKVEKKVEEAEEDATEKFQAGRHTVKTDFSRLRENLSTPATKPEVE